MRNGYEKEKYSKYQKQEVEFETTSASQGYEYHDRWIRQLDNSRPNQQFRILGGAEPSNSDMKVIKAQNDFV